MRTWPGSGHNVYDVGVLCIDSCNRLPERVQRQLQRHSVIPFCYVCLSVCMSIRLSVTRRYYNIILCQTAESIVEIHSQSGSIATSSWFSRYKPALFSTLFSTLFITKLLLIRLTDSVINTTSRVLSMSGTGRRCRCECI